MDSINALAGASQTAQNAQSLRKSAREIVRVEAQKEGNPIPNTSKAFNKLDQFLNLGTSRDLKTDDLTPEELAQFLKMLSFLLKKGVVGYHVYDVNGKPEKYYALTEIGDRRLRGKKLYDEKKHKPMA